MSHNILTKVWANLMTLPILSMFSRYFNRTEEHTDKVEEKLQRIKDLLAKKYKPMRLRNKTAYGKMRKSKRNVAYQSKLRNRYGLN